MLQISPPDYRYCPMCSSRLTSTNVGAKTLKSCPECKWVYYPHVFTAAGAIIKKDNQVLLVKRKNKPYVNTWMFPAGFIDYGEHPEETVVREVKEETGLEITGLHLMKVLQNPDDPRAPGHFGFFYMVDSFEGELVVDESEVADIRWFSVDNLPEIGWQSHIFIAEILTDKMI